jgi:hypothetical protein
MSAALSANGYQQSYRPGIGVHTNGLTLFGAVAVTAMLLFYALETRSPAFVLAFAGACLASSVYGFLQSAYPFGVVELVWSGVALRRWWVRHTAVDSGE